MRLTKNATIIVAHLHWKEISGGLPVIHSPAEIDTIASNRLNQLEIRLLFPVLLVRNRLSVISPSILTTTNITLRHLHQDLYQ
jgi:hypothetical protein